jgi:hypothetical protein
MTVLMQVSCNHFLEIAVALLGVDSTRWVRKLYFRSSNTMSCRCHLLQASLAYL